MANEVATTKPGFLAPRPSYLSAQFGDDNGLFVQGGQRAPSLTFQNRVWKIDADGEEHRLVKNVDGDDIPLPSIPVIILGFHVARGRVYYKDTFDAGNVKPPTCWSTDGVKPDEIVAEKQHANCAGCPMSVKGSRISDNNKPTAACSQRRVLAVVPSKGLDKFPALRLSLPITSDYDGQSPELAQKGLFAFSQYVEHLRQTGAAKPYEIITKLSFDMRKSISYPKVLFSAVDWVNEADAVKVLGLINGGTVEAALATSEGTQQAAVAEDMNAKTAAAKPATAPKPRTTSKPATAAAPEKPAEKVESPKAKAARLAAEAAAAAAAEAEADEATGDNGLGSDDDEPQNTTKIASGADAGDVDPKNPPQGLASDDDLSEIMSGWGSDD